MMHGYHLHLIKKGVLGEFSKIREEVEELEDAIVQNNPVMSLCEMSDILRAMKDYLVQHPQACHFKILL